MCKIEKVGFFCKIDRNFALTDVVALKSSKEKKFDLQLKREEKKSNIIPLNL